MNEPKVEISYEEDRIAIELNGEEVVEIKRLKHGTWAWKATTEKPLPLIVAQLLFVKMADLDRSCEEVSRD